MADCDVRMLVDHCGPRDLRGWEEGVMSMDRKRYGLARSVLSERLKYDEQMRQGLERDEWRSKLEAWCGLKGASLDRACAESETVGYQQVYRRASAGEKF
jgi:hypothetical protein